MVSSSAPPQPGSALETPRRGRGDERRAHGLQSRAVAPASVAQTPAQGTARSRRYCRQRRTRPCRLPQPRRMQREATSENGMADVTFLQQAAPIDEYGRALYAVARSIVRALLDQMTP